MKTTKKKHQHLSICRYGQHVNLKVFAQSAGPKMVLRVYLFCSCSSWRILDVSIRVRRVAVIARMATQLWRLESSEDTLIEFQATTNVKINSVASYHIYNTGPSQGLKIRGGS